MLDQNNLEVATLLKMSPVRLRDGKAVIIKRWQLRLLFLTNLWDKTTEYSNPLEYLVVYLDGPNGVSTAVSINRSQVFQGLFCL